MIDINYPERNDTVLIGSPCNYLYYSTRMVRNKRTDL